MSSRTPLLRLLGLLLPHRWTVALAVALLVATVASGVGLMGTSAWLISRAALHPSIAALGVAVVGVRFFGIARGVLRYLERLVSHDVTLRLLTGLRVFLYRSLEPLAPAGLSEHRSGDLLGRLVGDVETLESFYVRILGPGLAALGVAGLLAALLWSRGHGLAVAALAGFLLAGVLVPIAVERLGREPGGRTIELRAALEARLVDGVQGVADLLVYNQAGEHVAAVEGESRRLAGEQGRLFRAGSLGSALATLAADLAALAVLALAIPRVRAGLLEGEQLAVATLLTLAAFEAVVGLSGATQALGATRAAAGRVFALTDAAPAVVDPPLRRAVGRGGTIEVRNLRFVYPGAAAPALDGVSLRLEPGRVIALVGPSGSGKSTLVQLLLRFRDAPPDSIFIDGQDVRGCASDDVRARIASFSVRAHLSTGTILDNLRVAREDATDEQRRDVLRRAGLLEFVRSLPDGEATWVGEQGLRLSGGERQRLGLARALLKDAPILLLDEPTAHLDPVAAEAILRDVIDRRDRAVLIISHRLVGLEAADEIVVLDRGRVAERGRAAALRAREGLFARMWAAECADLDHPID